MENYILYCYKEWLEDEEGDLFKQIFKIPVMARILFALLLAGLISLIVILGFTIAKKASPTLILFFGIAYIILCIVISIYAERNQIKHSKHFFLNYKKHCYDMMEAVLKKNDISESFIPTLIDRYNAMINRIDEKIKLKREYINKFLEILLVPSSALILGALLEKGTNATETLGMGVSGTFIILMIYASAFFFLFLYDFVTRLPQGKYREFVTDLQSVLDIKKCEDENGSDVDVLPSPLLEGTFESANTHS